MHFILLDGYRGIAAIIVLIFHGAIALRHKDLIPFGGLAVDFFYCLSGFVICHAYESRLKAGMGVTEFMRVRIIRLYPMVAVGLIIGFLFFILKLILSHKWERLLPGIGSFILNAVFLPSPFTELANGASWPLNGTHWSLCFELLANILFAAVLVRFSKATFSALTIIAFIVLAYFAVRVPEFDIGWGWHDLWFGVIRVMFPFMAGVTIYWLHQLIQLKTRSPISGLTLITLLCLSLTVQNGFLPNNWYPILFVGAIAPTLIYIGAGYKPTEKQSYFLNKLGNLSYPLYAIHLPLVRFAQGIGERGFPENETYRIALVVISCIASIPLALACQRLFENPLKAALRKVLGQAQVKPT